MAERRADRMSDAGFRFMSPWFRIADFFFPKTDRLAAFGIREGDVVVDYGCGPGRYLEDSHQSRRRTKEKLALCPRWRIEREEKRHIRCTAA